MVVLLLVDLLFMDVLQNQNRKVVIKYNQLQPYIFLYKMFIQKIIIPSYTIASLTIKPFLHDYLSRISLKINASNNQKIKRLETLRKNNALVQYFQSKSIKEFQIEDIYYYLSQKSMFSLPNFQMKIDLINNPKLQIMQKFCIALNLNTIHQVGIQLYLLNSFNQNCLSLNNEEMAFCLKQIVQFEDFQEKINQNMLMQFIKIMKVDKYYFQILYYICHFKKAQQLLSKEKIKKEMYHKSKQQILKTFNVKDLYFMKNVQKKLNINANDKMQSIEQIRDNALDNKITFYREEQSQYIIGLLEYYPHYTYMVKLQKLSLQSYISYLSYLQERNQHNPDFAIISHNIPNSILEEFNVKQFIEVLELRNKLQIDDFLSISKNLRKYFTRNLKCIFAVIRYLNDMEVEDPAVWLNIQEILLVKLKISDKKLNLHKIFAQYNILSVFKLLGEMAINKLGSFKFWKHCNRLQTELMKNQQHIHDLQEKEQNKFIIYCFSINRIKAMNQIVEEKLINLALVALMKNRWPIRELYSFITCLSINRIGDNELWFALQNKLLSINLKKIHDQIILQKLNMIVEHFRRMDKGSYKFWMTMSELKALKLEPHGKAREPYINVMSNIQIGNQK